MPTYTVVNRIDDGAPDREGTWLIERVARPGPPVRIRFRGTREDAQAEADRLNALASEEQN
jgi:hypothetical protein